MRDVALRHERRHPQVSIEDCSYCERQRRHCREKNPYRTWEDCHEYTLARNIATDWRLMLAPYQCPWCGFWHATRVGTGYRDKTRRRRVEKERRKYLTQKEMERRELQL